MEFILNILIGLITGLISGGIVTLFFQQNDKKQTAEREVRENKQSLSSFVEAVRFELKEIYKAPDSYHQQSIRELRKSLSLAPKFFCYDLFYSVPEETKQLTATIYRTLQELQDYLKQEKIDSQEIFRLNADLMKAQFDMLKNLNIKTMGKLK